LTQRLDGALNRKIDDRSTLPRQPDRRRPQPNIDARKIKEINSKPPSA
jgi:hypothetical protein